MGLDPNNYARITVEGVHSVPLTTDNLPTALKSVSVTAGEYLDTNIKNYGGTAVSAATAGLIDVNIKKIANANTSGASGILDTNLVTLVGNTIPQTGAVGYFPVAGYDVANGNLKGVNVGTTGTVRVITATAATSEDTKCVSVSAGVSSSAAVEPREWIKVRRPRMDFIDEKSPKRSKSLDPKEKVDKLKRLEESLAETQRELDGYVRGTIQSKNEDERQEFMKQCKEEVVQYQRMVAAEKERRAKLPV